MLNIHFYCGEGNPYGYKPRPVLHLPYAKINENFKDNSVVSLIFNNNITVTEKYPSGYDINGQDWLDYIWGDFLPDFNTPPTSYWTMAWYSNIDEQGNPDPKTSHFRIQATINPMRLDNANTVHPVGKFQWECTMNLQYNENADSGINPQWKGFQGWCQSKGITPNITPTFGFCFILRQESEDNKPHVGNVWGYNAAISSSAVSQNGQFLLPYYDVKHGVIFGITATQFFIRALYGNKEPYKAVCGYGIPLMNGTTKNLEHPYNVYYEGTEPVSASAVDYDDSDIGKPINNQIEFGWVLPKEFSQKFFKKEDVPSYPDNPNPDDPDDPSKDPDPDDGEGGDDSTGDGDTESDPIPPTPEPDVTGGAGLFALYSMGQVRLNQLGDYLWSDKFINSILKLMQNPFEAIISLKLFAWFIPQAGETKIQVGNVETPVLGAPINKRFNKWVMLNDVPITEHFGSFLDYSPYTRISIYLPFIGLRQLNTDLLMGGTINVTYHVDFLTGEVLAQIRVKKTITGKEGITNFDAVVYQFTGNCAVDIPLTGNSVSALKGLVNSFPLVGKQLGTAMSAYSAMTGIESVNYGVGLGGGVGLSTPSASPVQGNVGANANVGVQGSYSLRDNLTMVDGSGGLFNLLCTKDIYLFIERPSRQVVNNYSQMFGVPIHQFGTVQNFKGYVQFSVVHIDQIIGSVEETSEIEKLLTSGVILPR